MFLLFTKHIDLTLGYTMGYTVGDPKRLLARGTPNSRWF